MPQNYHWTPPKSEIVHEGKTDKDQEIPPGFIRQSSENAKAGPLESRPPDIPGVYIGPIPPPPAAGWEPLVWRWADTKRRNAIQRVVFKGGFPAYRFEVSPSDTASGGTGGNAPRAELYSLNPAEKKRERTASAGRLNSLDDGDEYWATFAVYVPSNFPPLHKWATLFQRKLDDIYSVPIKFSWLTLNVHTKSAGTRIDVSIPGYPALTGGSGGATDDVPLFALSKMFDKWVQFTVHEKLSSTGAGEADVTYAFPNELPKKVPIGPIPKQNSFPSDSKVRGHFQYGYYRTNDPLVPGTPGPGTGVVYHTPLLISKTGKNIPQLP